jgi:Class II flagellar assembly regulator
VQPAEDTQGVWVLEIRSPRGVDPVSLRRVARVGGGEAKNFAAEEMADAKTAAALTGTPPIAAVDTILALQEIEDSTDSRARYVDHGEHVLKLLDEVRIGLLAGGIPRAMLNRLAAAVSKRREAFADPKLQDVLDEIDLRARVELAKLEYSDSLSI